MDKCFCHFNGYEVKDAKARNNIKAINESIVKNANFYDEITYTFKRVNNSNCYLINIPKYDNNGDLINLYVAEHGDGLSPNDHAIKNNTNVTINGSLAIDLENDGSFVDATVISNGEIINNNLISGLSDEYVYLGIKEDRTISSYKANSTSANTMISDGVKQAFLVFGQSVINGVYNEINHYLEAGPGQFIGQKENGDIIILTVDGRNTDNVGLTGYQGSTLLIEEGCVNVWILDGGGSTSTSFRGNKLNMNVDNEGRTDRIISYVLNVKKEIKNQQIADVYTYLGEITQMINAQLRPLIEGRNKIIGVTRFNINSFTPSVGKTAENIPLNVSAPSNNQMIIYNSTNKTIKLAKNGWVEITVSLELNATVDDDILISFYYGDVKNREFKHHVKANENQALTLNLILNMQSESALEKEISIKFTGASTSKIVTGMANVKAYQI